MPNLFENSLLKWLFIISISILLLYFGKLLFIPLFYGLLTAIVTYPFCLWLENKGFSKFIAITCCLLIILFIILALIGLLIWQIQLIRGDLPLFYQKIKPVLLVFREWIQQQFDVNIQSQDKWLYSFVFSGDKVSVILSSLINTSINALFMAFLIPIYISLFLYHRSVFVKFIVLTLNSKDKLKLEFILQQTIRTYSEYIKGMVMIYIIVGILNSIGLLALGIKHAILFGMLTAIMTIIPYIGIVVSALLPISIAFITKDSVWYPIGVIGVFTFVQYLEANVIFPKVVGKQLNISTWATLVAIISGGIIWGVSGMILFVPFVAILKIIAKNIPEWEALYLLLNRHNE